MRCAELCSSISPPALQDFFLRLVGSYRKFVRPDEEVTPAALALGIDRPPAAAPAPGGSTGGSRASSVNGRDERERAAEEENPR